MRRIDDAIVDPDIQNSKNYISLLEKLRHLQENLGPISNLLYNKGVSHVITERDSEEIVGIENNIDNDAGRYFASSRIAVTETHKNTSILLSSNTLEHEAGHALSFLAFDDGTRITQHPLIIEAYENDLHFIEMNQLIASDGKKLTKECINSDMLCDPSIDNNTINADYYLPRDGVVSERNIINGMQADLLRAREETFAECIC